LTGERKLFCFGFGFSAEALARRLRGDRWSIAGTTRTPGKAERLRTQGVVPCIFDGETPMEGAAEALAGTTHLLISIAPQRETGDPVLAHHRSDIAELVPALEWIGYLSTTGVYGNRDGGWVDETSDLAPDTERGRRRLAAETAWRDFGREIGLAPHIFRLAGIYGPGRNQLRGVKEGTARQIIKPGQIFSRIHVDDIAGALAASIARPEEGAVYNVCDDEPAPPQEVVRFAAELLGVPPPPEIPFEEAEMSPMARSFYMDSKKVDNGRLHALIGGALRYPTYREGLTALHEKGDF